MAESRATVFQEEVEQPLNEKKSYSRPELRIYGQVAEFTQGFSGAKKDGGTKRVSDRRTKHNITRVGDHPLGFGLYLFDYKPGNRDACNQGRQFGVMADEVLRVVPEAVSLQANGHYQVDYAMLDMDIGAS